MWEVCVCVYDKRFKNQENDQSAISAQRGKVEQISSEEKEKKSTFAVCEII